VPDIRSFFLLNADVTMVAPTSIYPGQEF
jgi:hypothetical protein